MEQTMIPRRYGLVELLHTVGPQDGLLKGGLMMLLGLFGLIKHNGIKADRVYIGDDIEGSLDDIETDLKEGLKVIYSFGGATKEPAMFKNSEYIASITKLDQEREKQFITRVDNLKKLPGELVILSRDFVLCSPKEKMYWSKSRSMAWVVKRQREKVPDHQVILSRRFPALKFKELGEYRSYVVAPSIRVNYPVDNVSSKDECVEFVGLGKMKKASSAQVIGIVKSRFIDNED